MNNQNNDTTYINEDYQDATPRPFAPQLNTFQGAIITLTNPEDDLFNLELKLRSMVLDQTTGQLKQIATPLMNDTGINAVLSQVQSTVSRNAFLTNLDEKNIYKIIRMFARTLAIDLMINKSVYSVKDDAVLYIVHEVACINAFLALNRPKGEGERRFWKGTQQEITTRMENKQSGGKGLGSMFGSIFK